MIEPPVANVNSSSAVMPAWRPDAVTASAVRILRGSSAVLAQQARLAEFARQCGQEGAADNLTYFLSHPDLARKTPCLVLLESGDALSGAVLLFEYRWLGIGLRLVVSADITGRRCVVAPAGQRVAVAVRACQALLAQGARIAFASVPLAFEDSSPEGSAAAVMAALELPWERCRWGLRQCEVSLYLPLYETFDQTLARIGQRTRSNLRYYRRRAERDLGCEFVPKVQISREELVAFNRACTFAVPDPFASWRFDALSRVSTPLLSGIRDRDGRWLSLIGGRMGNGMVEIDWQMNRDSLPAYSLSTVARSYLIEHVIGLGYTRFAIEGGTPHPIQRSFLTGQVAEFTLSRGHLLSSLAAWLLPRTTYLSQILRDRTVVWRNGRS